MLIQSTNTACESESLMFIANTNQWKHVPWSKEGDRCDILFLYLTKNTVPPSDPTMILSTGTLSPVYAYIENYQVICSLKNLRNRLGTSGDTSSDVS